MTKRQIHRREPANCNCDYGYPYQFNALPTESPRETAVGYVTAKVGSETTKTGGAIELLKNNSTYTQFADLLLSNASVIRDVA